jgi:hypothetical protein
MDSDYHSHTYFTVQELLDTDWDATGMAACDVILYADQYLAYRETQMAPSEVEEFPWEKDDFTREVTPVEMDLLLMSNDIKTLVKDRRSQGRKFKTRAGPYVKVTTPLTYRQLVPELLEIIPDLQKLHKDPACVRVVIAYDN